MGETFYKVCRALCAVPRAACIRETVLYSERANRKGPLLLACSHLSHLEPLFVGSAVRRQVRWMSRIEFYRPRLAAAFLNRGGAFCVDRYGYSAPAVRTAIRLLRHGEIVGMFPEGGVVEGKASVLRGGPIKQGVCTIAIETQTPVVPVVVLGTHRLNAIRPWLPTRSGRVALAFGMDVNPPRRSEREPRRPLREAMAHELTGAFVRLYHELLTTASLRDEDFP